jgi:hypothetical protein
MDYMDYVEKQEINFIIKKFHELPIGTQAEIYDQINSTDKEMIVRGGTSLLNLLLDNSKEFAKSVGELDDWIVWKDHRAQKAAWAGNYFRRHLKKTDSDFTIALYPLI